MFLFWVDKCGVAENMASEGPATLSTDLDHYLLSTIIPRNNIDGFYPFHTSSLLIRNEGFRREFARWNRSLGFFDPVNHPWKAVANYRWLAEYHLPVLRHWESVKRLYMLPHYVALGYKPPSSIVYDEDFLVESFEIMISLAKSICDTILSQESSPGQISKWVEKLKAEMRYVQHILVIQYTEEERYWPDVQEKEGIEVFNSCLAKMMLCSWRQKYHVGELYIACMLHVLGYSITRTPEDHLDIPYCGPRVKLDMIRSLPFVLRTLPLVQWTKRYLFYKAMINSVCGDDDFLGLERAYRKLQRQNIPWSRRFPFVHAVFWPFRKVKTASAAKIMYEESSNQVANEVDNEDTITGIDNPQKNLRALRIEDTVMHPEIIHRELMTSSTTAQVAQDAAIVAAAVDGRISLSSSVR